jgi:hypothetical protein
VRNDRNRDRAGGANTTSDLADTIELANGCACGWLFIFLSTCLRAFGCDRVFLAGTGKSAGPEGKTTPNRRLSRAPEPSPPPKKNKGCNLQDELFASFEQVLALADKRGEPYARIVLENSGVAEPHVSRDTGGGGGG